MRTRNTLGFILSFALLLSGCASTPAPDAAASPSGSPSADPAALGGQANLEALGIRDWSSVEELDWTVPEMQVAGWGQGALYGLGDPLANWMRAATVDPAMWAAPDAPAALDIVVDSLPAGIDARYRTNREGNDANMMLDGWSFPADVTVDDSLHALGWSFEPTLHEDGTGLLVGNLVLRSAWLLRAGDDTPRWVMTAREVELTTDFPTEMSTHWSRFGSQTITWGADSCSVMEAGKLRPTGHAGDPAFAAIAEAPPGTHETVDELRAKETAASEAAHAAQTEQTEHTEKAEKEQAEPEEPDEDTATDC